jgi:hypothetical protein
MSDITGGIRYFDAKPILAQVVDNGIDPNDFRVVVRTNEATKAILDMILPVGGMVTAVVTAVGEEVTPPPFMENAIDVEVMDDASVRGSKDTTQAFYDVINPSTYVDPSMAHDNPMTDLGLFSDPDDPTGVRLVRKYTYPGLQPNARLKITGAKRFIPLHIGFGPPDLEWLIVQNVEALKLMILSIERYENNSPNDGKVYRDLCLELLTAEVKKHIQDPRNVMRRKARYEDDVRKYPRGSFGWTRARIALEVPGAMLLGKSEIGRLLGDAELRLMERIPMARGCVKEYRADIHSGHILFPADVDSILGVVMCGVPLDIRAVTFKYLENGPGDGCSACVPYLEDEGEEYFPTSRNTRRKFRLKGISDTEAARLVFACKVRYVDKEPADQMTIKHYPSLSLMLQAIVMERSEKWNEANAGIQSAFAALQLDLDSFLKGIKLTIPIQDFGFGMGDVGGML